MRWNPRFLVCSEFQNIPDVLEYSGPESLPSPHPPGGAWTRGWVATLSYRLGGIPTVQVGVNDLEVAVPVQSMLPAYWS